MSDDGSNPKPLTSAYAKRKARAQALGYSSPRTMRDARARERGRARDYAMERERAERNAERLGYESVRQMREFRRAQRNAPEGRTPEWVAKRQSLERFGISERRYMEILRANRAWHSEGGTLMYNMVNTWRQDRTRWTPADVGYNIAFHAAIVNPETNWEALTKNNANYGKLAGSKTKRGIVKGNAAQFFYLVEYGHLESADEFETRYGRAAVLAAQAQGQPKP